MSNEETPKSTVKPESLVKGLLRFFNGDKAAALAAIHAYLAGNPYASKGEIFLKLSEGKGKGKPHVSTVKTIEDEKVLHTGSKYRKLGKRQRFKNK